MNIMEGVRSIEETKSSIHKYVNDMPEFLKDTPSVKDVKPNEKHSLTYMPDFFDSMREGQNGGFVKNSNYENINVRNGWKEAKSFSKNGNEISRTWVNAEGKSIKAYLKDCHLTRTREYDGAGLLTNTYFDDKNTPYKQIIKRVIGDRKVISECVRPNVTIKKGKYTAVTDSLGRTISADMKDITVKTVDEKRLPLNVYRDTSYLKGDHRGHLIADSFGGPSSKENIVPQNHFVNQSVVKKFENYVRDIKLNAPQSKIDVKVMPKYDGNNMRPTSFEYSLIKDGVKQKLPNEFKSIDNIAPVADISMKDIGKVVEKVGPVIAIGTFIYSTKDIIARYLKGNSSGGEFLYDMGKEATVFVSGSVVAAEAMAQGAAIGAGIGGPIGGIVGGGAGLIAGNAVGSKVAGKVYETVVPEVKQKIENNIMKV